MKTTQFMGRIWAPTALLGLTAVLLMPAPRSEGYAFLGGSLSTSQRDFRVYNNFADPTANDNSTADASFPGWVGAELSVWKAAVEWGSRLHGNGNGDLTQNGDLGSGGANFDYSWQGVATFVGGNDDNVLSAISSCGGGTLAYAESPISNGWRIRFCDDWIWSDGPGQAIFNQIDLQGVACHELGHALGLDHTSIGSAVMFASTANGNSQRDLDADDSAGVQALYGTASSTKPVIAGTLVNGNNLILSGSNFSSSGNEVWFTNSTVTSGTSPIIKVTGVSSSGGSISVSLPANAGPGDVLVKKSGSGNSTLSNAFPLDTAGGGGGSGPQITSISPPFVNALVVGTAQTITITGSGFSPTTVVSVDGQQLFGIPSPYTVVNNTTITISWPLVSKLNSVNVSVSDSLGSDTSQVLVLPNNPPALQIGSGDEPVQLFSLTGVDIAMAGNPGDLFICALSVFNQPSVIPGIVNIDIGNMFSNLLEVGTFPIGAAGWTQINLPFSGVTPLTTFFWQGVTFDFVTLPVPKSNVQETQVFF